MTELKGYKIFYEVLSLPRGKWAIQIEVTRMKDGAVIAAQHNPFPGLSFDTKLEALNHVNRYVEQRIAANEADIDSSREA